MSETPKNYEPDQTPELRLFQVVNVEYPAGLHESVIVKLHEDGKSVDTCIIRYGDVEGEETFGTAGTTYLTSITPTGVIWPRSRVVDTFVRSGYRRVDVERITPPES